MTEVPRDRTPVVVQVATTGEERHACFALRYRVLVEELKWDIPTADHHRKLDRTAEDDGATHIYASCNDDVIGTMRLHHGATTEIPRELREACGLQCFLADTPIDQMVTIGRLALEAQQRGGPATVALFQGCVRFLKENHPATSLVFIFATDEARLIALYRLLGFRPIDPDRRYPVAMGIPMSRIPATAAPSPKHSGGSGCSSA